MKELDFATIGRKIRDERVRQEMTQETLANIVDVNFSHISNIETGRTKVSLTLLVNICNALGTTVDHILENEYDAGDDVVLGEIIKNVRDKDKGDRELLLRIAKVL